MEEAANFFDRNIVILKDVKTVTDIVHEYTSLDQNSPLIIDNGSFQCRAGFANRASPQLIFKNLVCKPRKDRSKKETKEEIVQQATLIGNDIVNIEALRFQLRTQFDRNVVTHFYIQEQIFDYTFKHLGINTEGSVNHPIIMTEAMVNPNYCRSLMSEVLFECYQVPSIFYGIDSLFSYNFNDNINGTGLIISLGYYTTHIIPFMNGRHVPEKVRRINVGGFHMLTYMHRLMQLKYPMHVNNITLSRIEELFHEHSSICYDYIDDLKKWSSHEYYDLHVKKVQLPFSNTTTATLTAEQKIEKKKEMSRRLAEINARKREERLLEEEDQLQRLEDVLESFDDEDTEDFEMGLKEFNLNSYEELEKTIEATKARINKIKVKMQAAESGIIEEKQQVVVPQPPPGVTIDDWLIEVREKKNSILEKKQIRRQRRQDLAKRRTAAAQERMRIISKLAGKEKGLDDFGSRDEDWDVYKAISREQDSDSEIENEKLLELDEILRHHDPMLNEDEEKLKMTPAEYHQLHFSVEAIRAPELLFQPSMMGIIEAGLAETIDYVLKLFSAIEQQQLVDNIFLTGGLAKLPGLKERLCRELMEIRPFESTFKVKMANDASLDCWNGAKKFAANVNDLNSSSVTKEQYFEMGGEYLKENCLSNFYYKTPAEKIDNTVVS